MCLTLPGRLVAVGAATAQVELDGRVVAVSTILHPEVEAGDWVFVNAGLVVERLDPAEAVRIRAEIERAAGAMAGLTAPGRSPRR